MRILALAACLLLAPTLARAQEETEDVKFGLTGDWAGARTRLKDQGLTFRITGKTDAALNGQGGDTHTAAAAGQVTLGLTADLGKLIDDTGGTLHLAVTKRYGSDLVAHAGLGALMQVQAIYGRGDIWRLTQLYLEQKLGESLEVKLGRVNPGQDFDAFECDFQNLSFCGAQAGNLVGDYWFNSPVSQWGARAKLKFGEAGYAELGAYDVNDDNLRHGFSLETTGGEGTLVPFELAATPNANGLPGSYAVGGWYSTSDGSDVALDVNGDLKALTGLPARQRSGRYGGYLDFKQQVSGEQDKSGLTLFLRMAQADRRTSRLDRQVTLGGTYKAPFASRPDDRIGLAIGATHVNRRIAEGQAAAGQPSPQRTEYAAEVDYSYQLTDGLSLLPNLQYIHDPGGRSSQRDAVVLGLRLDAKL